MSDTSPNLSLTYLAPQQAQKHVTVNEALRRLDAIVQLSVNSRTVTAEPGAPAEGDVYILPASPTGASWATMAAHALAAFQDGAWAEIAPGSGWIAYVADDAEGVVFDGAAWTPLSATVSELQNLSLLGVGTTADATNPFSAKVNKALWTAKTVGEGGDGDLRYTLNKEAAGRCHFSPFTEQFLWPRRNRPCRR